MGLLRRLPASAPTPLPGPWAGGWDSGTLSSGSWDPGLVARDARGLSAPLAGEAPLARCIPGSRCHPAAQLLESSVSAHASSAVCQGQLPGGFRSTPPRGQLPGSLPDVPTAPRPCPGSMESTESAWSTVRRNAEPRGATRRNPGSRTLPGWGTWSRQAGGAGPPCTRRVIELTGQKEKLRLFTFTRFPSCWETLTSRKRIPDR